MCSDAPRISTAGRLIRWARRPRQANNAYAIVACAVLLGFTIYASLRWASVDDPIAGASQLSPDAVLEHVVSEHRRVAGDDSLRDGKLTLTNIDDAVFDLASHLRLDQLAVTSLAEAEFRFVGAGPCTVPGPAPSAHLLYLRVDGAGGRQMADASQWMSVFLIADGGAIDMPRPGAGPVIWRALTLEDASNAPDDALAALVAAESAVVCLVVLGREVDPAPVAEALGRTLERLRPPLRR